MYKNFKITDEERKEIMEQHKSHGYKKPLKESSIKEDDSNNKSEVDFLIMKFFDKKIEEFEYDMRDLFDESNDKFFQQRDLHSGFELIEKVINKIESMASQLKAEYVEREPSDDDIYNQSGSEGGVSYGKGDQWQGR